VGSLAGRPLGRPAWEPAPSVEHLQQATPGKGTPCPGDASAPPQEAERGNVAAIDCGTLSTRLLVCSPQGTALARHARITGLGEGVDASGHLKPEAVKRALSVLSEYRGIMDQLKVGRVRMVGTSALRDSANRGAFCLPASQVVGTEVELLSGDQEAALSFVGATASLAEDTPPPWLVVDIGGGSTELAVGGSAGQPPDYARSLNLGCVRVSERFLRTDPPAPVELDRASRWLHSQFAHARASAPALGGAVTLVGLAGTVSALACYDQGLYAYQRQAVHHYRLSRLAVEKALTELAGLASSDRASRPGIEPARAAAIVGGALVLATLMSHFGFDECIVSEADILDGLALSLLAGGPAPPGAGLGLGLGA